MDPDYFKPESLINHFVDEDGRSNVLAIADPSSMILQNSPSVSKESQYFSY